MSTFRSVLSCALTLLLSAIAYAVDVSEPIGKGVNAVLRNGRAIFIECAPPAGRGGDSYLRQLLAPREDPKVYAGKGRVAIPFRALRPETQRAALLAIFKEDYVDDSGWVHRVRFAGAGQGQETLWTLCEWLTGDGFNQDRVKEVNKTPDISLKPGQRILVPKKLLREAMRRPTPERTPPKVEEPEPEAPPSEVSSGDLAFGKDKEGPCALYRLKRGEASLYTPVVVRFTDFRENEDILAACEVIQKRSGVSDVTKMKEGQVIRIPLDMLSARFWPENTPERKEYEETIEEARRLRGERVSAHGLEGIVVILDAGHGGEDPGANMRRQGFSLYEDELNYDVCCRIRGLLEKETHAKVYMTVRDRSQGYAPVKTRKFHDDKDEELLTTPAYANLDPKYSANLRWYLANSIYREECKAGVDDRKVIFASFHCDALFNDELRGTMVYVPGAQYRQNSESPGPASFYNRYAEARGYRASQSTAKERRRDEALSRNFAETLLLALREKRVKIHEGGPPIRNVIRQSGGKFYLPTVLRNTEAPTKILVEAANMTNKDDRQRLADPDWRQLFAEAFVDALEDYYRS